MEENCRVSVGLRVRPPGTIEGVSERIDRVFSHSTNKEIHEDLVLPALSSLSFCTVFTYGRTGSGKTHTMFGGEAERGIFSHVLEHLLKTHGFVYVRCTEIYNEVVTDLLTGKEVRLVEENSRTKVINENTRMLKEEKEVQSLLHEIGQKRKTSETEQNKTSSRSHTVIEISAPGVAVNLVDLAGNEKIGENASRRKEGLMINKSLLTLGKVIDQLHDESLHVSYRESKLTRILQSTLSAGCIVCICTVISGEDRQTIKFAERIKRIKNSVRKPEKTKDEIIEDLQMQVRYLTEKLQSASVSAGGQQQSLQDSKETAEERAVDACEIVIREHKDPGDQKICAEYEESGLASETAEEICESALDMEDEQSEKAPGTVEEIHNELHPTQMQRTNLYEIIYTYFRSGKNKEVFNTLSEEKRERVKIVTTKKKRDPVAQKQTKTLYKESKIQTKPYEL